MCRTMNPGALAGATGAREYVLAGELDGSLYASNQFRGQGALFVLGKGAA